MPRSNLDPYKAFEDNIGDAEALLSYAVAFTNQRSRRMRTELRDRVGDALNIPQRERDQLDCLQSSDIFMVFAPGGNLGREDFRDLRPLLRQSIVAGCAALETYVADKAMKFVRQALDADNPPRRLKDIPLTVGLWIEIERTLTLPPKTPWILSRVRSMGGDGHETEQVSRGTDHRHPQRAPGGVASRRALPQVRGQRRDVLEVAVQVRRHGGIRRQEAEGAGG